MKTTKWMLLLVLAVMLSSCAGMNQIQQVAQQTRIMVPNEELLTPDPDAEDIIEEAFLETMGAWDSEDIIMAGDLRKGISGMFRFLEQKKTMDGSLSYYNYKTGFEFVQWSYLTLEPILDKYAILFEDKRDTVIYKNTKKAIKTKLEIQRIRIAEVESGINETVEQMNLDQMKSVYETLKPIIGTVENLL